MPEARPPGQMSRRSLSWLFLAALLPRLVLFAAAAPWTPSFTQRVIGESDAAEYHALAQSLVRSGRFSQAPDGAPETLRTPGYPALLAAFYALFGVHPWIPILFQVALDSLTAGLLALALGLVFPARLALVAGAFYAAEPFSILYANCLLSDVLFVHLLVVGLYFLVRSTRETWAAWPRDLLLAAVAWALAAWVRPPALFLVAAVVAGAFLGRRPLGRAARAAALAAAAFALVLSPWVARNWIVFGSPGFSISGSYNLLALYVTPMELSVRRLPYNQVKGALVAEADSLARADGIVPERANPFVMQRYWQARALDYITADPLRFARTTASGIVHSFLNLGTQPFATLLRWEGADRPFDTRSHLPLGERFRIWLEKNGAPSLVLAACVAIYLGAVLLGGGVGLAVAWRLPPRAVWWLLAGLAAFFLVASAAAGVARYRLPSVPFYLGFVAAGWTWIAGERARRGRGG